jgi:serine protease Do
MKQLLSLATLTVIFSMGFGSPAQGQPDPVKPRDILELEEQAFEAAIRHVAASVVRIETIGGLERVGNLTVTGGPTTGVVVSTDGYIISSSFNFIQKPTTILVSLPNGKRVSAEIINRDESRQLILLKVNSDSELVVPQFVPKAEFRVGQWSLALGRTLSPDSPNLSVGIVSAVNRIWGKAIQTDAKISPNNYGGALIDIEGRVLGVLVPMSPQANSEVAGAEWYDSGIGFAIPFEDIIARLETLRSGETLKPGLLGVALKGKDLYASPVEVTLVRINSPAESAGLKAGDVIVRCNEHAVHSQAQLRHALGPLYAGDAIALVVKRGDEQIEFSLELAAEIPPYDRPFLGLLPMRDGSLTIRHVFADSPADTADLAAGDQVVSMNEVPVSSFEDLLTKIRRVEPGTVVAVQVRRGEQQFDVQLTAGSNYDTLPNNPLPPAWPDTGEAAEAPAGSGRVEIKIPDLSNKCEAFIPTSYRGDRPTALLVYLHATGAARNADPLAALQDLAEEHQTIVVCPESSSERAWRATDAEFVRKVVDQMIKDYSIDAARVAIAGRQSGGAIAYLTAFSNSEVIRGIVPIEVAVPRRVRVPETDPVNPLFVATSMVESKQVAKAVAASVEQLRKLKYPVTIIPDLDEIGTWNRSSLSSLFVWLDTLDRI